jgi:phage-related protein
MAGSRTLKLTILGDVDNLNKSLKTATADVETFGDKMGKIGKVVGAAFAAAAAAAGAYAVKIGIDGVKAALDDEKAQRILAQTLQNTTGATVQQIAAVEDYITKTSLAVGVTDDQLRPAFSRLVRSTKDTEEAQKLLNLALDISSATGKPLEAISNSLGKAYDGNTNALGRLGLGIDQSILKTKDFNLVYENLRGSFAGFAANEANTFQGRIDRLKVAFDEAKETIGFALLPILSNLITFINDRALPIINAFAGAFGSGESGLGGVISYLVNLYKTIFEPVLNGLLKAFGNIKNAVMDNLETFKTFGQYISTYLAPIIGTVLGGALQVVGKIASSVIDIIGKVVGVLNGLIGGAITGINALIRAYNAIPFLGDIPTIPQINITGGSSGSSFTSASIPSVPSYSVPSSTSGGGSSGVGSAAKAGSKAAASTAKPEVMLYGGALQGGGFATEAAALAALQAAQALASEAAAKGQQFTAGGYLSGITVNVSGAIDPESTARQIVDILNSSEARGSLGAGALVTA